jgi:preprotein translocase subunit SecA
LFEGLLQTIGEDVTRLLMTVHIRSSEEIEAADTKPAVENVQYKHEKFDEPAATDEAEHAEHRPLVRQDIKVGRNEPCPCGSGKKYKHCHGKLS